MTLKGGVIHSSQPVITYMLLDQFNIHSDWLLWITPRSMLLFVLLVTHVSLSSPACPDFVTVYFEFCHGKL